MKKELSIYRFRSLKKEPNAQIWVFIVLFCNCWYSSIGFKNIPTFSGIFLRHKHSFDGYYWLGKQENDTDSESVFGLAWSEWPHCKRIIKGKKGEYRRPFLLSFFITSKQCNPLQDLRWMECLKTLKGIKWLNISNIFYMLFFHFAPLSLIFLLDVHSGENRDER